MALSIKLLKAQTTAMKNYLMSLSRITTIVLVLFFGSFYGCNTPEITLSPQDQTFLSTNAEKHEDIGVEQAKAWFSTVSKSTANARSSSKYNFSKTPDWNQALQMNFANAKAVIVPFKPDENAHIPRVNVDKEKKKLKREDMPIGIDMLSNLLIYRKGDKNVAEVVTMLPDESFYKPKKKGEARRKFTGQVTVRDLNDEFIRGYNYVNGQVLGDIWIGDTPKLAGARPSVLNECGTITYFVTVCTWSGCDTHPSWSEPIYCVTQSGPSGGGQQYLMSTGSGGIGSTGNGQYASPDILSVVGIDNPIVPKAKLQCLKDNNTNAYNYSITLYVNQPAAGSSQYFTPNEQLGHSFVGFTKTDGNGNVVNRSVVGFYPVNFANGLVSLFSPVDGVIKDNQNSPYDISYTVPLSATQFTTAVNTAMTWEDCNYFASGYNCVYAATDVFNSIGVSIPIGISKIMIGLPEDNEPVNIFVYTPGPLGEKLRQMKAANPSLNINSGNNMAAPSNVNPCN